MALAMGLNWGLLKAGCITRKKECEAAMLRSRAAASENPADQALCSLQAVMTGLDAMILECDANLALHHEPPYERMAA